MSDKVDCKVEEKVEALSADQVVALSVSAQNFGFDASWIADLVEKWGPTSLSLVIEAARNGLTVGLIIEIVNKFGPSILEWLVNILNRRNSLAVAASTGAEVVDGPVIEGVDVSVITLLLEKFLPLIMEKYGDQILKLIMDSILKVLVK